ncbi:MAG: prepilin-type N-terminal cleavage/methylation domain-containing protein [Patescibacteria group bacterium]
MISARHTKKESGFTLIELLVVISIISILSSVIFSSVSVARTKAKDSAIKSQVLQFRTLMEFEYDDTGSYANLNKGWTGTGPIQPLCPNRGYAGNYAAKAVEICDSIRNSIINKTENDFYTGVNTALGYSNSRDYSIMARLSSGLFFCVGSSGRSSTQGNGGNGWIDTGCYGNP